MKKAVVFSLLPLASLASAQSIVSNTTAAYGLGPSVTTDSRSIYATLGDPFNFFPPVTANPVAEYDQDTGDDGIRRGRADAFSSTDWESASISYNFSVDNALYFYLSGNASQDSTDELTLSNPDGATQGKYRVILDFVQTGSLPEFSVSGGFGGFGVSNVASSANYKSAEFDFFYDSPISTGLNLTSTASTGIDFISFGTGSLLGGMNLFARIEITDLGGATSFTQSSRSGFGYNVQAVPEPGTMAALAIGVGGMVRRRALKKKA